MPTQFYLAPLLLISTKFNEFKIHLLRLYSITLHYHQPLLFTNFTGFQLSNVFTSKLLPLLIVPFSQDRPHSSHHILTLITRPDLSVLPHSVCYMFFSPPRPSVAKRLVSMRSDMDHTVLPANYTMPTFLRKRSPKGASTECGGELLIAAHYSFIDPERMKGC